MYCLQVHTWHLCTGTASISNAPNFRKIVADSSSGSSSSSSTGSGSCGGGHSDCSRHSRGRNWFVEHITQCL